MATKPLGCKKKNVKLKSTTRVFRRGREGQTSEKKPKKTGYNRPIEGEHCASSRPNEGRGKKKRNTGALSGQKGR